MSVAAVAPGPASIELRGLTKLYGEAAAVDGIDLKVEPGELLSLLGPSGCGKTTTLRLIGGFEYPDAGEVHVGGERMDTLPPHRRPVNTVFQSYALFPHLSVADNVAYGLRKLGVSRAERTSRVAEMLDLVRMRAFAQRRPSQLSGGQRQRVALARALATRPRVLLLDEPMSALDRKLREEMQVELCLLQIELGITFVFVTHDQEEAMTMSDRIAIMSEGRIVQIGTPREIYDHPTDSFVAQFVGRHNAFTGRVVNSAADAVVVDTADVRLVSTRPLPLPVNTGTEVTTVVRPEAVTIATADVELPDSNALPGVVADVSELGHSLQVVVRTEDDHKILVRLPRSAPYPGPPGTPVICGWEPAAVHVLTS